MSLDRSAVLPEVVPDAPRPAPFRLVRAAVSAVERVSSGFARITFSGESLRDFGNPGATFDQRIKLVFPPESGVLPELGDAGEDWYRAWLAVPENERGSMRTYSIRELRDNADDASVVVDFVLHLEPGLTGPASRWAARAVPGDELILIGPRRGRTDGGGIEYAPGEASGVLLAGDETAAPAIARILEDAPSSLVGTAFIEVPQADDALSIAAPPGVEVRWLPRAGAAPGTALIPAVTEHLGAPAPLSIHDADTEAPLWETPRFSSLGERLDAPEERSLAAPLSDRYFWIAGESGVVTTLRRHLVKQLGVDRARVAFMGYWRIGVAMKG